MARWIALAILLAVGSSAHAGVPPGAQNPTTSATFWKEGPRTWYQFAKGPRLPNDKFMLCFWQPNSIYAAKLKDMGFNCAYGLWQRGRPLDPQLAAFAAQDIQVFAYPFDTDGGWGPKEAAVFRADNPTLVGHVVEDEVDAALHGTGQFGSCLPTDAVKAFYGLADEMKRDRPLIINFSPGWIDKKWPGRGDCAGQDMDYAEYAKVANVLSFDIYTKEHPGYPSGSNWLIYDGVMELRKLAGFAKPVIAPAEVISLLDSDPVNPTLQELRAQHWAGIIGGARIITDFANTFPSGGENRLFDDVKQMARVKMLFEEIQSLAYAINEPEFVPGWAHVNTVTPAGARVACRFSPGRKGGPGGVDLLHAFCTNLLAGSTATLNFHLGGGGASLEVINEGREVLANTDGAKSYTDTFAPGATHLYRYRSGPLSPALVDPGVVPPVQPPPTDPNTPPPAAGSVDSFATFARDCNAAGCYDNDAGDGAGSYQNSPLRWAASFPIPTLPAGATITGAELQLEVPSATLIDNADVMVGGWGGNLQSDPVGTTATQQSTACNLAAPYMTASNVGGSTGLKTITLPASFLADAQAAVTAGTRMTLCLQSANEAPAASRMLWFASETQPNKPRLRFFYTTGQAQAAPASVPFAAIAVAAPVVAELVQ